jgi:hypothetical protein
LSFWHDQLDCNKFQVSLSGVDAQGDSLTYSVVSNPAHGTLSISGNVATYTPANNYTGSNTATLNPFNP